jgi:hypothetical protein
VCGNEKEGSIHTVCLCTAQERKRYRTLGLMFLTSKDLENVRVNGLISLVANIGLIIYPF